MKNRVIFKITKEGVITPDTTREEDILLYYFLCDKEYFALEEIENLENVLSGKVDWTEYRGGESFSFGHEAGYLEVIENNVHLTADPDGHSTQDPEVILPIKELVELMKGWYKFQIKKGIDPIML